MGSHSVTCHPAEVTFPPFLKLFLYVAHRGSTGRAEHFRQTMYLPIWPPMTYAAVKCHSIYLS